MGERVGSGIGLRPSEVEVDAKGRVPLTAALVFTVSDSFDVGMDSYSPVSLAYCDRAPFRFRTARSTGCTSGTHDARGIRRRKAIGRETPRGDTNG
jgi:hypothetical protein